MRCAALVLVLALAAFGFAGSAAGYEVMGVNDGGIVAGVVKFVGAPPRLEPIHVNKNREVCGERKESEALVLGADRGVRGSVVLIEGVDKGKKPAGEVVIDNHKCQFVPHVAVAMMGERARVKNSDPILHNTHGFHAAAGGSGKQTVFNLALPMAGQVVDITRKLTKPGPIRVLCDAHTHMFGWLYVHDSPYIAVTDERGAFRLDAVPPGRYRVTMWHEGFRAKGVDKDGRPVYEDPRTITKEVTIAPKATATVEFELR